MAERESPPSDTLAPPAGAKVTPIVRDPAFVRLVGQEAAIFTTGRDTDISILSTMPSPVAQSDDGSGEMQLVQYEAETVEIARIRLPAANAFGLALGIIERGLSDGRVDVPLLRQQFDRLLMEYAPEETDAAEQS